MAHAARLRVGQSDIFLVIYGLVLYYGLLSLVGAQPASVRVKAITNAERNIARHASRRAFCVIVRIGSFPIKVRNEVPGLPRYVVKMDSLAGIKKSIKNSQC